MQRTDIRQGCDSDATESQEAGEYRRRSQSVTIEGQVRRSDEQAEGSSAGILCNKTRVGDLFQATSVPELQARTAEAKQEDLKVAPEKDHLVWDSSRAPDERRLQQLIKRLHIGSIEDGTRRPKSLLSHADVVAALHRCKYDPASAEASLVTLARRRESKHNIASAHSEKRSADEGRADQSAGTPEVATAEGGEAAEKSTNGASSQARGDEPTRGVSDAGGNRWEDWSEVDRATFLVQLGEKHKDVNDMVEEFPTKSHSDIVEFYYNWKFHDPDYSRWQSMKRQIDIALTFPDFHQEICEICEEGGELLLCDTCSLAFHLHCLSPRLEDPPDNDWSCPECLRKHVTPESRARAKLFVKQRIASIEEQRRCMAKDEECRYERQSGIGYLGEANGGFEHSIQQGGEADVANIEKNREKVMKAEEVEAHAERELSNRPWGKEDLAQLQRAVEEFGERGWRVMMASEKYKSLFHMRSPPIVKSMHRMLKDHDLKRAKARARIAARADTKARGEAVTGADGGSATEAKEGISFAEADAAAAAVAVARIEAHESVEFKDEEAGGPGTFQEKTLTRDRRALLQKLVLEHGVRGLETMLDMPSYGPLKEVGSPSALSNAWRSMQHRLRRRLERQGMVPRRRPGRPPKNLSAQHFPVAKATTTAVLATFETSKLAGKKGGDQRKDERRAPVAASDGGEGEPSLKKARAEQTENVGLLANKQ